MFISTRTPEGLPFRCPVCGAEGRISPSLPGLDATCPACGSLMWMGTYPGRTQRGRARTRRLLRHVAVAALISVLVAVAMIFVPYPKIKSSHILILVIVGVLIFGKRLPEAGGWLGSLARKIVRAF